MFNPSRGDGFQVSVSSLTLGTLYEAIIAFSSQDRFETFWPAVCQNSRWLMPSRRMCIVLHSEEGEFEIVGQFEQGKFQTPDDPRCEICEGQLEQMLTKRSAQWMVKPYEQLEEATDGLMAWLFKDQPETLFMLPISVQGKPFGAILFVMSTVEQADQTMLTALGTVYALHVGMAYMLIQATEERRR
jgi:transcriptional regulator with GAF, ATPase, and Fis domain